MVHYLYQGWENEQANMWDIVDSSSKEQKWSAVTIRMVHRNRVLYVCEFASIYLFIHSNSDLHINGVVIMNISASDRGQER